MTKGRYMWTAEDVRCIDAGITNFWCDEEFENLLVMDSMRLYAVIWRKADMTMTRIELNWVIKETQIYYSIYIHSMFV